MSLCAGETVPEASTVPSLSIVVRKSLVSCRRLLREQFKNGRLDAATSKAEVLEELCDKLNFDADAAAALHKQLYREKLTSVVADKKISGDLGTPRLSAHLHGPHVRPNLADVACEGRFYSQPSLTLLALHA